MKYLITGGCGFLGSNLAAEVLRRGEELILFDNLSRPGTSSNLEWLCSQGEICFIRGDIRDPNNIARIVKEHKPHILFHLAGQVAMTTSIQNPRLDFEINSMGTLNVLEAVRLYASEAIVIYSSTNKVYGDLEWVRIEENETRYVAPDYPGGFDEALPLNFHSPYGCSKGVADQYTLDYARMFRLKGVVFRHSSIYGGRQFSTHDQGWIGWFCQKAIDTRKGLSQEPFTISGNGKQVRDILHAEDVKNLYFQVVDHIEDVQGLAFNIGGGMGNSLSLLELFEILEKELDIRLSYTMLPWRASDQKVFVADINKARDLLFWEPEIDKVQGIRMMLDWLRDTCVAGGCR